MNRIELKSRKLLRKIFGCISVTAVAFTFQACYGHPYDQGYDVRFTGSVESKNTNLPIKGIKVTVANNHEHNYGFTDENGNYDFYAMVPNYAYYEDSTRYMPDSVRVHFFDVDSLENGHFADQTIIINPAHKDEVKINVKLEEKE